MDRLKWRQAAARCAEMRGTNYCTSKSKSPVLDFKGHEVKGQGPAATTMEIL